jgi:hypothetical protein
MKCGELLKMVFITNVAKLIFNELSTRSWGYIEKYSRRSLR